MVSAGAGSAAAAEDLVQEIYLRIAQAPPAELGSPEAWLYRVGSNLMLDRIKQQRRMAHEAVNAAEEKAAGPSNRSLRVAFNKQLAAEKRAIEDLMNEFGIEKPVAAKSALASAFNKRVSAEKPAVQETRKKPAARKRVALAL